jgi:hypothetical protein
MAPRRKRPGVGAKASLLTRFIHPKQNNPDKSHRSDVILISRETLLVNRKQQVCFTFNLNGTLCHAVQSHFNIEEEGKREDLFDPPEREIETNNFKEPKIKWQKSKAKKDLYNLIMEGVISDDPSDHSTLIEDIYYMSDEFQKYSFEKFEGRLKALRKKIQSLNTRAEEDERAFEIYKKNHAPALFSHKGYIQWQGSESQELLWDDLDEYMKNPDMKPKDLWSREDRPYKDEFPLEAFRDKIKQEIRTAKYIATRIARDKGKNV